MSLLEHGFAIVCVDQDTVGKLLDTIPVSAGGQRVDFCVAPLPVIVGEAQLEHLACDVLLDQRPRRTLRDDLPVIHDDQPVA